MVSLRLVRNLLLMGLSGSLLACSAHVVGLSPGQPLAGTHPVMQVSQIVEPVVHELDAATLLQEAPSRIPMSRASSELVRVGQDQIASEFAPDTFTGEPGVYVGFAPGFSTDIFANALFYETQQGTYIPYVLTGEQYVPLCFFDQSTGLYFYPMLVLQQGEMVPAYYVADSLFPSYTLAYPITVPLTYVSPLTIVEVPAPVRYEPIVVHPRTGIPRGIVTPPRRGGMPPRGVTMPPRRVGMPPRGVTMPPRRFETGKPPQHETAGTTPGTAATEAPQPAGGSSTRTKGSGFRP